MKVKSLLIVLLFLVRTIQPVLSQSATFDTALVRFGAKMMLLMDSYRHDIQPEYAVRNFINSQGDFGFTLLDSYGFRGFVFIGLSMKTIPDDAVIPYLDSRQNTDSLFSLPYFPGFTFVLAYDPWERKFFRLGGRFIELDVREFIDQAGDYIPHKKNWYKSLSKRPHKFARLYGIEGLNMYDLLKQYELS